jgi:hypothetical protein
MISVAALLVIIFLLCARLQRRFEQVLPAVVLGTMLLLTLLAMAGQLALADVFTVAACAAVLLWALWGVLRRRQTPVDLASSLWQYGVTPGLLLFAALAVFYWFAAAPMTVWWRDDLAHWGLQVKSIWYAGGLVPGAASLNPRYGDYPPGVQVLQWLTMHAQGAWSEQALYFTMFLLYAVFLLPLVTRLRWRRAWLLPLLFAGFVALPTWGNVLSYVFLGVDTALSLCFGYVLLLIWRHRRGDRLSLAAIALGLCGLFLIKQIGALLLGFAAVLYLLRRADTLRRSLPVLLAPVVVVGGWFLYCGAMGLSGFNTGGAGGSVTAILQGAYALPENAAGVLPALLNALCVRYVGDITLHTAAPLGLPLILWLTAFPLAALALGWRRAIPMVQAKLCALYLAGMTLAYLLVMYLSFFTTFYYETAVYTGAQAGNMVLLIERYMAPLILGQLMLLLALPLGAGQAGALPRQTPVTLAVLTLAALLMVVGTNWAVMGDMLLPERYVQSERAAGSEATVRDQEMWGEALDGLTGARVLIDLPTTSDYTKEIVYSFAPAKFFQQTPENSESVDVLTRYLLHNDIGYLVCLDDTSALAEAAAPLAGEDGLYSYTLYAVEVDGDTVTLTEA